MKYPYTSERLRVWRFGRLKVKFSQRSSKCPAGRFGGGWNWKVGLQASRRTLILSLLVAELRIDWKNSETEYPKTRAFFELD